MIKHITLFIVLALFLFPNNAYAWFFFWLPLGGGTTASQPSDTCVAKTVKAGDKIPSGSGNTAIVRVISGTSSRCKEPKPILATLDFQITEFPEAAINLAASFQSVPITEMQKYQGYFLIAKSKSSHIVNLSIFFTKREAIPDPTRISEYLVKSLSNSLEDVTIENEERLVINNMTAWQYTMKGRVKAFFGGRQIHHITVLEGAHQYFFVQAYTPESDYEKAKDDMIHAAEMVTSINEHQPPNVSAQ